MKRLAAIIIIVIAACALFLLTRPSRPAAPFAEIFPPGAVAYAGLKDGRALADDILASNCWRNLRTIESVRGFTAEIRAAAGRGGAQLPALKTIAEIIGEKAAIAFYPKESPCGAALLAAVKTGGKRDPLLDFVMNTLGGKPAGSYGSMELVAFSVPPQAGIEGVYAHRGDTGVIALSRRGALALAPITGSREGAKTRSPCDR